MIPDTPLATLSGTSRTDLDASRIRTLQKSNGFVFSVRDRGIATKLATNVVAFEDLEETMVLRCK